MNILLLGNGGREHVFAWMLRKNPMCEQLFIAPGNAGTDNLGINLAIAATDFPAIKACCLEEKIDLVVVGPEAPLVAGIVDFFKQDSSIQHIPVIGPDQEAAQLEGSKAYAKVFMEEFGIPTAGYREFSIDTLEEGLSYIEQQKPPIVLKADGLAAGKGVLILDNIGEAKREFQAMLEGKFGDASSKVVIEEFLDGIEFSIFALTDGKDYQLLPIAKDYKRIGEGDTGLNTGGMGSVSPVPFVDEVLYKKVVDRIVEPTINGLNQRELDYTGFVFFGLIAVQGEPFVIEYNCRMGDPETQVVFPRLKNDLLDLLIAAKNNQLDQVQIEIADQAATAVILVSGGYPEAYQKGKIISGEENVEESIIFHAGTKKQGEEVLTNGGRVLAVTSFGDHFQEALQKSYASIEEIHFDQMYYRTDIGFDL